MAYVSPYQTAGVQQSLMDTLLSAKVKEKEGEFAGRRQKSEMVKEYGADYRETTEKINEASKKASRKRRKRKWYEKFLGDVLPILSLFIPAIGPGIAGGLAGISAGYGASKDASFAEGTAKNLQKYIKDTPMTGYAKAKTGKNPWEGTFLSEKAADYKAGRLDRASDLDSVIAAAQDAGSFGNVFGTALQKGISTYAMTKMAGEIGEGFGGGAGATVDTGLMSSLSGPGGLAGGANALAAADYVSPFAEAAGGGLFQGNFADSLGAALLGQGEVGDDASLQLLLGALAALQD